MIRQSLRFEACIRDSRYTDASPSESRRVYMTRDTQMPVPPVLGMYTWLKILVHRWPVPPVRGMYTWLKRRDVPSSPQCQMPPTPPIPSRLTPNTARRTRYSCRRSAPYVIYIYMHICTRRLVHTSRFIYIYMCTLCQYVYNASLWSPIGICTYIHIYMPCI